VKNILKILSMVLSISACQKSPESAIGSDKNEYETNEEILFKNNSKNAKSYKWDFGDNTFSELFEPTKKYEKSGKYKVQLSAFSKNKSDVFVSEINIVKSNLKFLGDYQGIITTGNQSQAASMKIMSGENDNSILINFDESSKSIEALVSQLSLSIPAEEKYQGNGITTITSGFGEINLSQSTIQIEILIDISGPGFTTNKSSVFVGSKQ